MTVRGPERAAALSIRSCLRALVVMTTSNGSVPPWPRVDAFARSGCAAPSATSTLRPARSFATWIPRTCQTRRSTSHAGTGVPRFARLALRPTGPTPTSSSVLGWPVARVCLSRWPFTRACLPPSRLLRSVLCTAGWSPVVTRSPAAGHGAKPATARTVGGSHVGSGTARMTPVWASRCVLTATATTQPWCGTLMPPSCGGGPSSVSAVAWISSPANMAYGSSCPTPRWPNSSVAD
jgi:hypothetical protein